MSAAVAKGPSGYDRPSLPSLSLLHRQPGREPDPVVYQLDLATEAALTAIPCTQSSTRIAAAQALEASIERHLTDGGLDDVARRYRLCRQRRAVAQTSPD